MKCEFVNNCFVIRTLANGILTIFFLSICFFSTLQAAYYFTAALAVSVNLNFVVFLHGNPDRER